MHWVDREAVDLYEIVVAALERRARHRGVKPRSVGE
jgi:hypothetical protein